MNDKIAQLEKNMTFISTMKGRLILTSIISASTSFGIALAGYRGIFLHIIIFILYFLLISFCAPPYLKFLKQQAESAAEIK
jgi:predicted Na+-dependent transporter